MDAMHLQWFAKDPLFPFFIQFGFHDKDLEVHHHVDFSELVIVLGGTAIHVVNDEEYPIGKGDVFVINSNTSHGYRDADSLRICNIMYRAELLVEEGRDLRMSEAWQSLFVLEPFLAREYRFKSRLHLNFQDFQSAYGLLELMLGEYGARLAGWQALVHAKFLELVVMLTRWYARMEMPEADSPLHIARAVSFMENNCGKPVSLSEIAARAYLSPRHFSRLFRESYGTSPMNHLLRLRIQNACNLLRKSGLGISEVGWQCGFEDSNYFSRQFRRIMGMSPKDYRGPHSPS